MYHFHLKILQKTFFIDYTIYERWMDIGEVGEAFCKYFVIRLTSSNLWILTGFEISPASPLYLFNDPGHLMTALFREYLSQCPSSCCCARIMGCKPLCAFREEGGGRPDGGLTRNSGCSQFGVFRSQTPKGTSPNNFSVPCVFPVPCKGLRSKGSTW